MKKVLIFIIVILYSISAYGTKIQNFAVLPFKVNGPEEFRYLSQGVRSMLVSRLTAPSKLEPMEIKETEGNKSKLIQQNNLDILIFGDVTVIGKQISIDIKAQTSKGKVYTKTITASQDNLLSKFNEAVTELKGEILGIKPEKTSEGTKERTSPNAHTKTSINPAFEYVSGVGPSSAKRGYIRTQSLPYEMVGLDVGDSNGDGKNEVFILSYHKVYAYLLINHKLKKLGEYEFGKNRVGLNINVFDSDKNGYSEIFISAIDSEGVPSSLVLTFKNNNFKLKQDRIKFYLNVKRIPPEYTKRLVGQGPGIGKIFSPGVHEVITSSGKYSLGMRIKLPEGANVFNFAYLPEKNSYKIVVADDYNHLKVFSDQLHILYKTSTLYGGSSIKISTSNALPGLANVPTDPEYMYYLPTRIIPYDLEGDGQFEIIVAHNISISSMIFSRYRDFPEGQMHGLIWDGVGLNIEWKTKTIKGSIMDYGIKDIDNDAEKELYVGINTHPGPIGFRKKRTIVLIYKLNTKK